MIRVTLMHELSDHGPAWARLPVAWPQHPDAEHMGAAARCGRVLADRRAARTARRSTPAAPPGQPGGDRWVTGWLARRRLGGAMAERELAEALRRLAVSPPERLSEAQPIPAGFLPGFAGGLLTAGPSCCGRGNRRRRCGRWAASC